MKKFLILAAVASAVLAGSATLPKRTLEANPSQMKSVSTDNMARRAATKKVRRAAEGDQAAISVPFTHTLGKNTEVNDYLVIDSNGDGRTWKPGGFTSYSVCMAPNAEGYDAADDWLISPAVHLEAGEYYTVSYEEDMTLNKTEDILGLYAGKEQSAEGMTMTVVAEHAFPYNNKVFTKKEAQFSVTETGNYYFGFHCTSEKANSGTPKICNFSIEVCENPVIAPDNAIEVPFKHTLGKNTEVNDYTLIDADGDTKTWKPGAFTGYSVCTKPASAGEHNDDWLISLPVHLLPGVNYTLSYEEGFMLSSGKEETLGIYYGTDNSIDALTTAVVAPHAVTANDFTVNKTDFTVAKEGYYYFGFHCTSAQELSGNLKICNFSIAESTEDIVAPAAGHLEVTGAPKGELKATVTYTAPTVDIEGKPLSSLSKVIVTVNWGFKTELTDVVPGGVYTFETTDVYNNAYNRFEAVAYIGEKAGESALITDRFFGMDNPLPPTNVKASLSPDFKSVTISWDPVPAVGEKGGYVDVSKVEYYVFDAFGSYYDPALLVTTSTSATLDYSNIKSQDFVAYQITAGVDETYYSLDSSSNIVVVGEPDPLPFFESFADGYYSQMWVVDPESDGQMMEGTVYDNELRTNYDAPDDAEPEYLNSHDGDNGFYFLMPMEANAAYGFYSAKIDISGASKPVFEFWYQGKGSLLEARVGVDGSEPAAVHSIDLKQNSTDDWTLARVDLSPYRNASYIQVGIFMRAIHNTDDTMWSVPVDNMRVIDLKDQDVRLAAVSCPSSVKAGDNIPLQFTIENIGTSALTGAQITLTVDNVETVNPLTTFHPGKVVTYSTTVPTSVLSADVINVKASAKANNTTVCAETERNVAVKFPAFPMPEDLSARAADGKVELEWTAPEFEALTMPNSVDEDFENPSYEPFTYQDFGGFTFIDLDGAENYTFLKDVNNPYRCEPMAYQLFNPALAGVPEEYLADCPTHSGDNMLVAWSCDSQNGNLLISPELTGEAQTVSFWGRGFTVAYPMNETFSVWVSYTDTNVKSFTQVQTVYNYPADNIVPETWTEFLFDVPAGAKYFAILHDAYDSYALFLDDFKFEAASQLPLDTELTGFNLYRDNEKAGTSEATAMTDVPATSGIHAYCLSAVYNHGESRATKAVEVDFSAGIESASLGDGITISCHAKVLNVEAPEGTLINVYDLNGRLIASSEGTIAASLDCNIAIVKAGDKIVKIIVE